MKACVLDWEGRTFTKAIFNGAIKLMKNILGNGPFYVFQYDVNILVSTTPVISTITETTKVRNEAKPTEIEQEYIYNPLTPEYCTNWAEFHTKYSN